MLSYLLSCICVCVCVFTHLFACMHRLSVCVFKQDTNIDCSLIILPSALFKALINSLILERYTVDAERKDEVLKVRHILWIKTPAN